MKKIPYAVSVLLACALINVSAAREGGGGGQESHGGIGVVCRNADRSVKSVELLDLFEASINPDWKKADFSGLNVDQIIDVVTKKLAKLSGLGSMIRRGMYFVKRDRTFLPAGIEIVLNLSDSLPSVKRAGCDFEQIANYKTNGALEINAELYDKMDPVNVAALLIHEALYLRSRQLFTLSTSKAVRDVVGVAFGTTMDQNLFWRLHLELQAGGWRTQYSPKEAQEYFDTLLGSKMLVCEDNRNPVPKRSSVGTIKIFNGSRVVSTLIPHTQKETGNSLFSELYDVEVKVHASGMNPVIEVFQHDAWRRSIEIDTDTLNHLISGKGSQRPELPNAKLVYLDEDYSEGDAKEVQEIYCWTQ